MFRKQKKFEKMFVTHAPKDPTQSSPINKFVYINLDITNEIYKRQGFLDSDNWDYIIKNLKVANHFQPVTKNFPVDTTSYNLFHESLGLCLFDNFEKGIEYLKMQDNGLLIKVEKVNDEDIGLTNINWIYLLSNQVRTTITKNFLLTCNSHYNSEWLAEWNNFSYLWEDSDKQSYMKNFLHTHAFKMHALCEKFISNSSPNTTEHLIAKELNKSINLLGNEKIVDVCKQNYFIFIVDCKVALKKKSGFIKQVQRELSLILLLLTSDELQSVNKKFLTI